MKLLGAGLIWISLICLGLAYAHNLQARCYLLDKTKNLIEQMMIEIKYMNLPLGDLLRNLNNSAQFSSIDYISFCLDNMNNGYDFPVAWKKAVTVSSLKYRSAEKDKLLLLGEQIGKSDLNGTLTVLSLYKAYFDEYEIKAKAEYNKYGNLSALSGFLGGCLLFILTI